MTTDKKDQEYYNKILHEGERDSIIKGVLSGIASISSILVVCCFIWNSSKSSHHVASTASIATGLGVRYAQYRGSPITFYMGGVLTCLSGLIVSQLMAHYLYIGISDKVGFERRMDAAKRTEERTRRQIEEWSKSKS